MARLPRIKEIDGSSNGTGFYLCARKDRRSSKNGSVYLSLLLQDVSGEIGAKVFNDVEQTDVQFDVGEFVAVHAKGNLYNGRLELILDKIRRVIPSDAQLGFREEDCIPTSPRPLPEMWTELEGRLASVQDPHVRALLNRVLDKYGDQLRVWPAARQVHHAYRSGLLEHILKIMEIAVFAADAYSARRDLVIAGALLHDIGKLEELNYAVATDYSLSGNLIGHIVIGVGMVRDLVREIPDFPRELALEIEHLILSHHSEKALGSPVTPMTVEAFILAAADNLDATLHQVRKHLADDDSEGRFTSYQRYLETVLLKPPRP